METLKPNPELFLNVMKVYLNRLAVKRLIIDNYSIAKEEVYFDMVNQFPDEEQQNVFRKAIDDFDSITNVEEWYNEIN